MTNIQHQGSDAGSEAKTDRGAEREFLDRREAAEYLNRRGLKITRGTLQKYATTGGGPVFRRFGRKVLYTVADLQNWAASKISGPVGSSSEPADHPDAAE